MHAERRVTAPPAPPGAATRPAEAAQQAEGAEEDGEAWQWDFCLARSILGLFHRHASVARLAAERAATYGLVEGASTCSSQPRSPAAWRGFEPS